MGETLRQADDSFEVLAGSSSFFWCPTCLCRFHTTAARAHALPFATLSLPQFLAARLEQLDFRQPFAARATVHDACKVALTGLDVDGPRPLLASVPGLELVEMERTGAEAACCGSGAYTWFPSVGGEIRDERLAEASGTGADTLIDVCHYCHHVFLPEVERFDLASENWIHVLAHSLGVAREDDYAAWRRSCGPGTGDRRRSGPHRLVAVRPRDHRARRSRPLRGLIAAAEGPGRAAGRLRQVATRQRRAFRFMVPFGESGTDQRRRRLRRLVRSQATEERSATMLSESESTAVIEKAKALGASVAGVADVEPLKESPSHRIYPKIGMDPEVRWQDAPQEALHHEVEWPADAVSAVVIGVEHSAGRPELDWYDGKGTPGNRILIRIVRELSAWLEETFSVKNYRPPYVIESTGIFLKDSAVLAGLGCVGKNNMVITPEYGPRIRWRALLVDRRGGGHRPARLRPLRRLPAAVPQGLPRQGVRPRRLLVFRAGTVATAGHRWDLRPGELQHSAGAGRR